MSRNSRSGGPSQPKGFLAAFWDKTKEKARSVSPRPKAKRPLSQTTSATTLDTTTQGPQPQPTLTNTETSTASDGSIRHSQRYSSATTSILAAEPIVVENRAPLNTDTVQSQGPSVLALGKPNIPNISIQEERPLPTIQKDGSSISNHNEPITQDIPISKERSLPAQETIPKNENPPSSDATPTHRSEEIVQKACWERALEELTDEQREVLRAFRIENPQTFENEVKTLRSLKDDCKDKLSQGKGGKPIITRARIHNILKKMEKYAIIGDLATQGAPETVTLVWAGVRFCLQVALNDMQTFEGVSSTLDDIAGIIGSCTIYEKIYSSSELESAKAVVAQLPRLYSFCLVFMARAIDYYHTKAPKRVAGGIINPFETRFKPLIEDINAGKEELGRRAAVASHELQDNQRKDLKKLNDLSGEFRMDMVGVKSGIEMLLAHVDEAKKREIFNWLSTIDFRGHHEKAQNQRFDGTGTWLFENPTFESWIETDSSSVMWLSGKAGSGKTVLSSLVVDALHETYKSAPIIYFYCNYAEPTRRETLPIMKSLLRQLSTRIESQDPEILNAFKKHISLTTSDSESLLGAALSRFDKTFIVLDALDECSEEDREYLVKLLTRQLKSSYVKIFFTSRPENDLRRIFKDNKNYCINVDDTLKDIRPFVEERIDTVVKDQKLLGGKITTQLKDDLIETISSQADGMFLWARLQLDHICKQGNENEVRAQLRKLPRGLNNTYDRIWTKITSEDSDDSEKKWALKTLKLVLYAKRPLRPQEILEATAIEPGAKTFDPAQQATSLDYLVGVCGNFLAFDEQTKVIRFVHYSVQEYLKEKQKEEFDHGEDLITEICFTVLGSLGKQFRYRSIYSYASEHWDEHARNWEVINDWRENLIRGFLFDRTLIDMWCKRRYGKKYSITNNSINDPYEKTPYQTISRVDLPTIFEYFLKQDPHDMSLAPEILESLHVAAYHEKTEMVRLLVNASVDVDASGHKYGSALQAAAFGGSEKAVQRLLDAGADVNAQGGKYGSVLEAAVATYHDSEKIVKLLLGAGADVNSRGGKYGSALQVAAYRRSEGVVRLLLDAGADVNAQGGEYGSALQAAYCCSEGVVQLLLDAGADVNAQGGEYGSALQAAAYCGSEGVVQLLLDAGADVNAQGGEYRSALQAAAYCGSEGVVQLLLDAGADVSAQGGEYGSALQAAASSYCCSEKVVQLLLDAGADVNAQGGKYGSALQAAAYRESDSEEVVQLLLDTGADVNAQGGEYGSALQAAAHCGSEKVVQLLLDAGADVNAQGGEYGSALKAAAYRDSEKMVQLLLDASADVNAQDEKYGSALLAAAYCGSEGVVQLLLDAGADVNAQGGLYGSALQAAAYASSGKVVKLLLDAGADVNAQGGEYGSALQAAAHCGSEKVVQLLLDAGADVNAQGGEYGSALQAAAYRESDSEEVVQLLLDTGADVNAQGGEYGSALQAATAAYRGSEKVVQLLLDAGSNVNAQGGLYGSALQAAAYHRSEGVVQLLLDAGADIDAQGEKYGSALQAAAYASSGKVVKLLLDAGADVNAQGGNYGSALQAAAHCGSEKVVQLLLDAGADVSAQGGEHGSALQAAAHRGSEKVVQLLLNAGADFNTQGGNYGSALQAAAASYYRSEGVVRLLLDAGADVNAQGGEYGSALQAAAATPYRDSKKVVLQLLDAGADVNAQGGKHGSALQAAREEKNYNIVNILKAKGATH